MVWMILAGLGASLAFAGLIGETEPDESDDGDQSPEPVANAEENGTPLSLTNAGDATPVTTGAGQTGATLVDTEDGVTITVGENEAGSLVAIKTAVDSIPGDAASSSATSWSLDIYLMPGDTAFPDSVQDLLAEQGEADLYASELPGALGLQKIGSWPLGETGIDEAAWLNGTADAPEVWDTRVAAPEITANRPIDIYEAGADEAAVLRTLAPSDTLNPWSDDVVRVTQVRDGGSDFTLGFESAGSTVTGSEGDDTIAAFAANPATITLSGGGGEDTLLLGAGHGAVTAGDGASDVIEVEILDEAPEVEASVVTDYDDLVRLDIDEDVPGDIVVAVPDTAEAGFYELLLVPEGTNVLEALHAQRAYSPDWHILVEGRMPGNDAWPLVEADRPILFIEERASGWTARGPEDAAA